MLASANNVVLRLQPAVACEKYQRTTPDIKTQDNQPTTKKNTKIVAVTDLNCSRDILLKKTFFAHVCAKKDYFKILNCFCDQEK